MNDVCSYSDLPCESLEYIWRLQLRDPYRVLGDIFRVEKHRAVH